MVTESTETYEIIEQYSESQKSWYLPSLLVYAEHGGTVIHILFAVDHDGDNVRVITVYRPDPATWEEGFRRKRRS